jgi:hypothetical protein
MNGKLCSVAGVRLHDDWKAKCKILKREHIAEVVQQTFKHFYSFIKDYMDNTQNPFCKSKV